MANNRLFLGFKPSGEMVYLGRRMGFGWCGARTDLRKEMDDFFDRCEDAALQSCDGDVQDHFVLLIEDGENAPDCEGNWRYADDNRKFTFNHEHTGETK